MPPRTAVERTLTILRLIHDHGAMRADELAGAARLPVSTVYRYLRTLREYGLVTVQEGVYAPGWALDGPAGPRVSRVELIESATPVLRGLVQATGETAALSVRVGTHAVCVQQVKSPHSIRVAFEIGQMLPLHAGASERVLLAYAPEQVVHAVLSGELRQYTRSTPNHSNLASKLRSARASWVATSRGEFTSDAIAVAAPVLCDGEIVCAIEVAGPDRRCGHDWLIGTKELIADAVRGLTSAMESLPRGAPALARCVEQRAESAGPDQRAKGSEVVRNRVTRGRWPHLAEHDVNGALAATADVGRRS